MFTILGTAACDSSLEPLISLLLSQPTVQFRAVRGNAVVLTQTITVSNSGGGRLGPVTCPSNPATWLTCAVTSGNRVDLTANPTGLTSSPAPVTVTLEAPGVSTPASVLVELTIEQPVIGLSTGNIVFTASENSAVTNPPQGLVNVTNAGAGSLSNLGGISCVPTPLTARVTCSVNQGSGVLSIGVDPTGLTPGTHVFPLTVSAPNATGPQTLTVTLNLTALPRIVLSQRVVHFQAIRGSIQPLVQTVAVTNSGSGSLGTISCSPLASWLTCTVSGSTLTLTASPALLASSPLPATVNVSASGAANSPQTITATFAIEQPILSLTPSSVSFSAIQGTTDVTPTSHSVQAGNVGAGTAADLGVLTCAAASPITCSVNPTARTIIVGIDPLAVTPGTAVHFVTVNASNSSVSQTVAVSLTVAPPPTLVLTPASVTFRVPVGSTALVTQTVALSNSGGGTLGDVTCPALPAAWLTCSVTGTTLTLVANPNGLISSPTPVSVDVVAANAPNDIKVLPVALVITHTMALSANTAAFSASAAGGASVPVGGTTTPASVVVTLSNGSGGSLADLGAIGCQFPSPISCSVNQGTGQITLTLNPVGRTPGTHTFTVNVTAANGSNSPLPITVTLTVTP
jgi:hypothetical protein